MASLRLLRRVGVTLFFFLLAREAAGTSQEDGTPTMSPTVQVAGNETLVFPSCSGDEKFDERVTELFFREGCLLQRKSHANDVCPVDTINGFMSNFVDAVRFESIVLDVASVLLLTCIGCAGGIPNPTIGTKRFPNAGKFIWAAWMLAILFQWLVMFGSSLMVVFAFFSMRSQYWPCLVEMSNGDKLIDVVAGLTFPLQPLFLAKQAVMLVYALLMYQGTKVWRSMVDEKNLGAMNVTCLFVYTGLAAGFNALFLIAWFFSLSWTVGLVVFIPLTFAIVTVVLLILGLLFGFSKYVVGDTEYKGRPWIVQLPMENLRSMVGWIGIYTVEEDYTIDLVSSEAINFTTPILLGIAIMALSPLVVYSTWLMMFIYAGNPTHKVMDILALEYKHCFAVFRGVSFQLPSFDFSLADALFAVSRFADLTRFAGFDPSHFMEASLALTALNFLISLVKPLLCGLSTALGVFGMTASQAANIPIAFVATCPNNSLRDISAFVRKVESELAKAEKAKKKENHELAVASPNVQIEVTI